MLKYWINSLLGKPTVRGFGPEGLLYRENRRSIQIGTLPLTKGYAIDVGSIVSWDDKPEEVLGGAERRRIAEAVRAVLKSQWGETAEILGDQ